SVSTDWTPSGWNTYSMQRTSGAELAGGRLLPNSTPLAAHDFTCAAAGVGAARARTAASRPPERTETRVIDDPKVRTSRRPRVSTLPAFRASSAFAARNPAGHRPHRAQRGRPTRGFRVSDTRVQGNGLGLLDGHSQSPAGVGLASGTPGKRAVLQVDFGD